METQIIQTDPPGAFGVLCDHNDSVLIIKDQRKDPKWGFPGGRIEMAMVTHPDGVTQSEEFETPFVAAARKVEEEVGLRAKRAYYVGMFGKKQPAHLIAFNDWEGYPLTYQRRLQASEVSAYQMLHIPLVLETPSSYEPGFYPAQWKMLGWYIYWRQNSMTQPIFGQNISPWSMLSHNA